MVEIYCVKCRKFTETKNVGKLQTSNNRHLLQGICVVCGTKKSKFISASTSGKGFLNKEINSLPFEMHLPRHNFTGPGTKLNKRLNPDLTPKAWSKPINRVDQAAYHHDIFYVKNKDTKTRNEVCDKNMLEELDGIYNPILQERIYHRIVRPIIGTKKRFGMGLKKNDRVFWSSPLAAELRKPVIKNFHKRKVFVNSIDKIWAADLVDMQ